MTTSKPQTKTYTGEKPEFCTLNGVAMYARVFEPAPFNEMYNIEARWELDVLLTKAEAAKAEARGMLLKAPTPKMRAYCEDNGLLEQGYDGTSIKIKKSTTRKKWDDKTNMAVKDAKGQPVLEPAARPRVVDSHGTEIPEEANLQIGNGSKVSVTFTLTKPQIGGREQFGRFGGRLLETKILDLVQYKRPEGSFVFDSSKVKAETATDYRADDVFDDEIPFLPDED